MQVFCWKEPPCCLAIAAPQNQGASSRGAPPTPRGKALGATKCLRDLLMPGTYLKVTSSVILLVWGELRDAFLNSSPPCSPMARKAHSPLQYAAALLEVSHHFIFGDFLMCLFLSSQAAAQALLHLAEEQSLIVQSLHAPASAGTNTIALLDLCFQSQPHKGQKCSKSHVR